MKRRSIAAGLSLLTLVFALGVEAQLPPLELELGFRMVDVDGNEDMYRTQIDEEEGFLLRYFTIRSTDERGLFDYYRVVAHELGESPAGSLRFEAGRSGLFETTLMYRRADSYSALPAFANPLIDEGIIPGQHTWDRTRQIVDFDVEILAFDRIVPFFGYTWTDYDGPGTTTYNFGQDEFLLRNDLEETSNEFRLGASFNYDRIYGVVTQGWRQFDGDEELTLAPGAGQGNNPGPVVGRPVDADSISRLTEVNVDTPFTNLYVTGELTDNLRLIGKFVQLQADSDVTGDETASGAFASFANRIFFGGLNETVDSSAENDTTIAGIRGEWLLNDRIVVTAGFDTEDRELEGSALVRTLYLNTMTFGGFDDDDLEVILNAENSFDRTEDTFDVGISASQLGPFGVFARYSMADQEITMNPDVSEIVVPGSQGGTFERSIDTFEVGGSYAMAGFSASASLRKDDADDPIMRTDYLERERVRARLAYSAPSDRFGASITGTLTDQSNDDSGFAYDSEIESMTANLWVAVVESFRVWASASNFDAESTMLIRNPINFNLLTSFHNEEGEAIEGGFTAIFDPVRVDASYSTFENDGTRPFDIDRLHARVAYAINAAFGVAVEWETDEYDETDNLFADYDAERIGLYLRWTP